MSLGFGLALAAILATFAKRFSKFWFFYMIVMLILIQAGMIMNAASKKGKNDSEDKPQPRAKETAEGEVKA